MLWVGLPLIGVGMLEDGAEPPGSWRELGVGLDGRCLDVEVDAEGAVALGGEGAGHHLAGDGGAAVAGDLHVAAGPVDGSLEPQAAVAGDGRAAGVGGRRVDLDPAVLVAAEGVDATGAADGDAGGAGEADLDPPG